MARTPAVHEAETREGADTVRDPLATFFGMGAMGPAGPGRSSRTPDSDSACTPARRRQPEPTARYARGRVRERGFGCKCGENGPAVRVGKRWESFGARRGGAR